MVRVLNWLDELVKNLSNLKPLFLSVSQSRLKGINEKIDAMGRTMCYNTYIFLKEG